jgi:hypothetical protein
VTAHNTKPSAIAPFPNTPAPNYPHGYMPYPPAVIGSPVPVERAPQNANVPKLFEPITIRGVTWPNRMWVAPMCQCE